MRGMRANGLASAIAGMFAAFPFIAFMENVGLVILTGVRSRWVVAISGVFMCVVALVPKFGAVVASTPAAALGGAGIAMFGVVVAAGMQTLAKVDFERNRYNVLIVGFTIATALIPGDGAASLQAYARLDAALPAQRRGAGMPRVGRVERGAERRA